MNNKELKFAEVKQKVAEHLKTALGVEDFIITFAKLEKDVWKVNVEFKEKIGTIEWPTTALFSIDVTTGEAKQFEKGRFWRF
ncbi:MAG: hypothetical protein ACETVW_01545 [Dehalococcoidia bacterium]